MRVLTQQPQGKTFVNRTTKIGKDITFLWSGANPGDDSTDNLFIGAGVNAQAITTKISDRGQVLAATSTGALSWRLYDPGTNYTASTGLLRKGTNAWTQGVIFKYRSASEVSTTTEFPFNITNSGSWNHRIFVNATGFVQVRNPSWTAGVFLTSDVALTEGDWVSVVVVWESGNTRFYVNGVLQTQTSNLSIYTSGLERAFFCPVGIDLLTAFVADTGWTGEDALSWHNNPWQLFKPQPTARERLLQAAAYYATEYVKPTLLSIPLQPRGIPYVNKSNYLGQYLKFLWTAEDSLFARPAASTGSYQLGGSDTQYLSIKPTSFGIVLTGNMSTANFATADYLSRIGAFIPTNSSFTWGGVFRIRVLSSAPSANHMGLELNGTGSSVYVIRYEADKTISINFQYGDVGGRTLRITSTTQYEIDEWVSVVATVTPTGGNTYIGRAYINGELLPTSVQGIFKTNSPITKVRLGVNRYDILTGFVSEKIWSDMDVKAWHSNPWQLFSTQVPIANKLLNIAADYPIIYTPGSDLRSLPLTTPSKVNTANPITKGILFASSPAHGTTDAVSDSISWSTGGISTVYGRGGLAWVYGRAQQSESTGLSKPVSSQNYSLFAVLSLEITKVSQITSGYYYAGPGFGHDFTLRIAISNLGKVYVTNGTTTVVAENVTVPVNKVITIAATGETGIGTKIYLNGKLIHTDPFIFNTGTVTYQPRRISYTGSALPAETRPWYTYLTAAWGRTLTENEVKILSQDPLKLFARPQVLNKRLIHDITFDVPQAITKSSYVQTANIPRKPVLVNLAHPLARNIKFTSGPTWDKFDASNNTITYATPTSVINAYGSEYNLYAYSKGVYTRYGLAFKSSVSRYSEHVADKSFSGVNSHTLLQIVCLEADQYPFNFAGTGLSWGDANSFRMSINNRGYPYVQINGNAGNPPYLTASLEVVPLRKLAVLVSVVEQGVGTKLYINGKVVGFTTTAHNSQGGAPRRILYSGDGSFSTAPGIYLSCGWHRALSETEVQQISENPWQMFQQPSKFKNRYAEAVASIMDISRKFLLFFG